MAVGDVIASSLIASTSGYLTIQPSGTVEWVVHNIVHGSDAELWGVSNLASAKIDVHAGAGMWAGQFFHNTNINYYSVRNIDSGGLSGKLLSFDGIVTHT